MKLNVETTDFVSAVAWATKSYDSKDGQSYVSLNVDSEGKAKLTHVNQNSYMSSSLKVNNVEFDKGESEDNVFSVALDGMYLQKLANVLGSSASGEVKLSKDLTKKNSLLEIRHSAGKFTVPLLRVNIEKEPSLIKIAEVNDNEYFNSISRLAKLCSPVSADAGAATGAVAIHFNEDQVTLMATDSFSLGEVLIDYKLNEKGLEEFGKEIALIPSTSATMISGSKVTSDTVELVFDPSSSKFGYRFDDNRLALFSLDQSNPIMYSTLKSRVNEAVKYSATASTVEIKKAIDAISTLAWDEVDVKLIISSKKNAIIVTDENANNKITVNAHEVDFSVDDEEKEIEITFMRNTIKASFSPITTESFSLKFLNEKSPCVLASILDDGTEDENVFAMAAPSV